MGVKLSLDGMNDFRDALRALPQELAVEAAAIVWTYASQAKVLTHDGYPVGHTSNLRNGVTLTVEKRSSLSVKATVSSRAPHAWIFENGTSRRMTNRGANRGRMPKAPDSQRMVPRVQRIRARMVDVLIAFVREKGFVVNE